MRLYLFVLALAACNDAPRVQVYTDAPTDVTLPPDADPCGDRTGMRGKTQRTITAGGLERTYIVYLPSGVPSTEPLPLLFVMHGYSMSGQSMYDVTEFPALADREHVALAFPDGQGGPNSAGAPWNVGQGVCPSTLGPPPVAMGDDFAFLDAMKADISHDQCIDRDHVFIAGFSMGGFMSHHANCMRSDIRAAAPASGGTHDLSTCTEGHKPIIMFHGVADEVIPAGCDDPHAPRVPDVTPAATAWAIHNGCSTTTTITSTVIGGRCEAFLGCPDDGQVSICTFDGMGHCWAGGPASAGLYACPGFAPATELAWDFFKQHAW